MKMYILKNAWKNLYRNIGRNILMGIILFGIITASVVGVVINQSAGRMIIEYKSRFGTKVVLSPDIKKFRDLNGNLEGKTLTNDMLISFAKSEYVKSADFMNEAGVCAVDFKEMDSEVIEAGKSFGGGGEDIGFPTAKLKGYSAPELIPEFTNGTRKIVEGSMFEQIGECIISEDLAIKNSLHVGDTVTVMWVQPINGQQLKMKISGIYFDSTPKHGTYGDDIQFPFLNRRNEILSDFETVQSRFPFSEVTVSYYINSPDDVSNFETEMRQKGLPDTFYANADMKAYQKVVEPVENLRKMATIFLVVILILGSAILILMSFIAIRERRYEIGVLRSIGMKKIAVIANLVSEIFIVNAFCLTLGICAGSIVSDNIGNYFLKQQEESVISEFSARLDSQSIYTIVVLSILLSGVASISGISTVIRHEPIDILTERG